MHADRFSVSGFLLFLLAAPAARTAANPFAGRWDLTLTAAGGSFPSWLEVVENDNGLQARLQGREGAARPAAAATLTGGRLVVTLFTPPPRTSAGGAGEKRAVPVRTWELTLDGGALTGFQRRGDAVQASIRGVRAPALKRAAPAQWTAPEPLFNGKDLTGWVTMNNTQNPNATASHWTVKNGELVNEAKGRNLRTTRTFNDFQLHVEFNLDSGANSGIYLRGRYECQLPPPGTRRPGQTPAGPAYAIHGMVPAAKLVPGNPGEWRSYDATLIGRYVTLVLDGVTIVDNQEIPGITGGAIDSNEAEPGPIHLQGDHSGGIRFRNITISVPRR